MTVFIVLFLMTMRSGILLIILFLLIPFSVIAQNADEFLSEFLAVKQNNTVYLRWTIKAGNTCVGTRIQKSLDNQSFDLMGEISGVCGSPDKPVSYEIYDSLPAIGKTNYYRLEMGPLGLSDPISIDFILFNSNGYSVQPNPLVNSSKLYFENPRNEIHTIYLINQNGKKASELRSNSNFILIQRNSLRSGLYIFKIMKEGVFISSGKLMVL
ncbi:T9SS type A sorting domain-containing protein [Bacteroidota bacterium]